MLAETDSVPTTCSCGNPGASTLQAYACAGEEELVIEYCGKAVTDLHIFTAEVC